MLEGLHIPLCVLASMGLFDYVLPTLMRSPWLGRLAAWRGYDAPGLRRLLLFCAVIVTIPSNLYLLSSSSLSVVNRDPSLFYESAEVEAIAWLEDHTERSDTVLSSYEIGRFIPARVGQRVFMGHFIETMEVDRKRELASTFFQSDISDSSRYDLLDEYGIRYLFHGPREQQLGDFDPSGVPYLTQVYANERVAVYRVDRKEVLSYH
jgi:hypothetical protein